MTRPRRHRPVTAAPDIRAASKVNSTGPIPGAERVDPENESPTEVAPTTESPDEDAPAASATSSGSDSASPAEDQAPSDDQALSDDQAPSADGLSSSPDDQADDISDRASEEAAPGTGPQWISGTAGATVPVTHGGRTYKAKQGDTLYGVASKHGVSVPALAELNRISPRQNLHQGQVLSLPEKNDLPDDDPSHVVAPGETLQGVAARHGISPATLRQANAMGDDSFIKVGELLLLRPSKARPRRTAPEAPSDVPRVAASAQVEGIRPAVLHAARLNKYTLLHRRHPAPAEAKLLVASVAVELGADPALMQAVAAAESGFQHTTVSAGNAIGIMQVTPRSGRWASDIVGRGLDLLDIADNIVAGTVILGWLIETAESENEAIAGYYQDLRSVRTDGLLPETKAFVRAVQLQRARLQEAQ
ncbi:MULTISPECIES: LysM peptidoglycan-binding domain-containing protein [unclassified Brevibacterium]|uniref:LysM peptidoglycan-binding domain-containing protein n=1 Tax=unclassified Brevibacterium TaxID=2614124 RepID=UPI0010920E9F|nr:LysM peptidoglycan-binding domain-containing protein [Brevibacterium sp. S22]TGD30491.1 LysM peptidoglycan-binding domain-containing protein [Brevibacterium sp. S22]